MSLSSVLPPPTYTGEEEQRPHQRSTRVVGPNHVEDGGVIVRRSHGHIPSYRERQRNPSWWVGKPLEAADFFGDGGALPEIPRAQYPLGLGKKDTTKSNALAVTLDANAKVDYGAIARLGHNDKRVIQTSFKDLIPLRQRADAGDLDLSRPSQETVEATAERTKNALASLIGAATAAQKPKSINVGRADATFVRYTPANQMGEKTAGRERIIKVVGRQLDPMEPARWKHKKIPGRPPSPPPPVLRSPPRKLTAADQEAWRIPPSVSNWKNPKGYTVPLDKRVAANGQALQDISISDKHAQLSEALRITESHAREEVKQRVEMQKKLAEMERVKKEAELVESARMVKAARRARSQSESESEESDSEEEDERRAREDARRERMREEERKLRQSRMGTERRLQVMAREQNRDMSEKIALGLAKPSQSKEAMYDSRLFNQTSGFDTGFNEDNPYDKPLFEAQNAIASIYRPRTNMDDDDDEAAGDKEMAKIQKAARFGDALGKGAFKGSGEAEAREGPVQFQKEAADPFNVDQFLSEVEKGGSAPPKRGYGLQESESRQSKRARVEDDD